MESQIAAAAADAAQSPRARKVAWWGLAVTVVSALVYLMATAKTGPQDPTEATRGDLSHGTVVFNTSMIVFREGLEAILILAAVTASFLGADRVRRRPVFTGALAAFGATVLTWILAGAVLQELSGLGMRLEAITGFLAVAVLLVVMNWFVHKVYWTGWISKKHKRRRELLSGAGGGIVVGLLLLGFTSVYREGFEVVLFLQNLRVQSGSSVVLEGVAIGLSLTLIVGVITFRLQQHLPYKKMLIATGILLGVVLVVMIGGTAATFQDLGWLPRHDFLVGTIPAWMGAWFEVYPTVETIAVQVMAAGFVIGSYYLAEYLKVRRPAKRGRPAAVAASAPPVSAEPART